MSYRTRCRSRSSCSARSIAAATLLGAPRASVRLFDAARSRLIAKCRFGEPLHPGSAAAEFRVGEGLIGWIAAHNLPLRTGDAHVGRALRAEGRGARAVRLASSACR